VGWGIDEFPAFFSRQSGLRLSLQIHSGKDAAEYVYTHWGMGFETGILFCVPCPETDEIPHDALQTALAQVETEAKETGVRGGDLTPYLLTRLAELTAGATLKANSALLRNNAFVAGEIAVALSKLQG
jgi:pseudouridine-5'-phosphate glycosidase